jgi:glycosyltransferase involved in cell wall biosynthesis
LRDPKILFFTSGHSPFSSRLFFKELKSLQKVYARLAIIAPHEAKHQTRDNIEIFGIRKRRSRYNRFSTLFDLYKQGMIHAPDILHCHEPDSLLVALFIKAKLRKTKVIYDCHEFHPYSFTENFPHFIKVVFRKVIERIENYMASKADAVITVNDHLGKRFNKQLENVVILPNYPPINIFNKAVRSLDYFASNHIRLIYVGGLSADRGLFKMAEILAMDNLPLKCQLYLFGNFSSAKTESLFWQYTDRLNVSDQIIHRGFLPHEMIIDHLSGFDIGLCLLDDGRQRYHWSEPIKYFEYSAAGLPVILSDLPAMQKLIKENKNGYAVNFDAVSEVADTIKFMTENKELTREMGQRGKKSFIEKYNWEVLEKRLLKLYSKLT